MRSVEITHDPISTSLDRDTVAQVKVRFLALNDQRFQQAKQHLSSRQQQCLELLPLLLHFNHPRLPGYQSKATPCGFSNYSPTNQQLQAAKSLAKGFKANTSQARKPPLLALYVMGSTGTIAQSHKSDMDFWLCHSAEIPQSALAELEKKCAALTQWAKDFELDWHFFLMQPEAFSQGEHGELSKEGSGSSQHFLLLDEFYRSAILLAGQIPLWWFITTTEKNAYRKAKDSMIEKGFLRPHEWLDFGPVGDVPPSEFVSAAIWQLYKSITSPFKSLLKLLILEVYLSKYPRVFTLSDRMKMFVYAGQFNTTSLDPYLMLLNELSSYFIERKEFERLELMRQCFYFKLQRSFQSLEKDKRAVELLRAIEQWQWQPISFAHLDASSSWNAQQVMNERRSVINELTASYKSLLDMARHSQPSINVNSQEITVLGRKLHAAFSRTTGKIELINPNISNDILAKFVVLLWDTAAGNWQLYLTNGRWEKSRSPMNVSSNIAELFCWGLLNNIIDINTRIKIQGNLNLTAPEVSYLVNLFSNLELDRYLSPTHTAFTQPAQLSFVAVLTNDPTFLQRDNRLNEKSFELDPLNTSDGSLVKNFSVLSINSWAEVRVQKIGEKLEDLLHWLVGQATTNATVQVRNLSLQSAALIEQRLKLLCDTLLQHTGRHTPEKDAHHLFVTLADEKFLLVHFDHGWQVSSFGSSSDLWQALSQPAPNYRSLTVDPACHHHKLIRASGLTPLTELSSNSIQILFRIDGASAHVYCKDERGSLFYFEQAFHDQDALLKPLHHFLRAVLHRNPIRGAQPMFGIFPIEFYEVLERAETLKLERRHATSAIGNMRLFDLQFCIESLDLALAPSQWQLSAWLNGEAIAPDTGAGLFHTVARTILSHRQSGQRYPCYITDLDLSLCEHQLPHFDQLQTSHYLKLKFQLERALNHALKSL
ncbi:class I adenylate cyclase [Simiduia curdlanivorans]|uniref:Class I adenylate cyclase n=1 Tax=Simiduia curdlanivorans TaxID=1492769 RepID=A0ABV8V1K6_9GAMM|nr:class I adenylate cyclase [Simiduia curdlanivorans]MDN3638128.1 class I adenylate cyclase [Simiduia curdlanivorans]